MAGANSLNRMTSKFVMYPSDDTVLVSTYASAIKALGEDLTMELYTSNSEDCQVSATQFIRLTWSAARVCLKFDLFASISATLRSVGFEKYAFQISG
jgi:hypothetical protein